PFRNDLNLDPDDGGHGTVYFYRSPRFDTLIVEYYRVGNWGSPDDTLATFEVILSKNGNIKCQYLSVGTSGMEQTAVIGIAEYDCASVPYLLEGDPSENIVSDSTAVLFDYAYIIWEMAGDANYDGDVNVGDAVYLINWIFKGGATPPNMIEADANCDGDPNVADAVYIINFVFRSGPPPCLYEL
ncbi:MAG: dockerin type I domain-containing protein, partial [Planctomycetota bacterium]